MGGCRCSYRTCKVRSDGQTHMFHFPVFDKMRCHQWITNAHKPNFLNLKLSQLRNRVICQNHFKDDSFMNYMRDRLKSDAVPTDDGPFCVSDQCQTMISEENDKPSIPINADDIENEMLNSLEKKAHSSVKYGDFLISDVTELFNASHNSIESTASQKKVDRYPSKTRIFLNDKIASDSLYKLQKHEENHNNYTISYPNEELIHEKSSNMSLNKDAANPTIVAIEYEEPSNINKSEPAPQQDRNSFVVYTSHKTPKFNPNKVVKILSEKTILSEPVLVGGKLKPFSPTMILQKPIKKLKSDLLFEQGEWDVTPQIKSEQSCLNINLQGNHNVESKEQSLPIEYAPEAFENNAVIYQNIHEQEKIGLEQQNEPLQVININNIENQNILKDGAAKQTDHIPIEIEYFNSTLQCAEKEIDTYKKPNFTPSSTPVYKSVLKNKIAPEKLAAIEEKRKFNLKLRDVITSCLDNNVDDQKVDIVKKIPEDKKPIVKRILLSKDVSNPSNQSSMISYLETRLQKMENTLLNKIDHNTQRINELKRTIKPSSNTRSANTQTYLNQMNEQSQKQYLYKEISKFLSPNTNIKIYEELFLDKTSQDNIETSPRRKLRRKR